MTLRRGKYKEEENITFDETWLTLHELVYLTHRKKRIFRKNVQGKQVGSIKNLTKIDADQS